MRYAHEYLAKQNVRLASNQIEYSLLYRCPETNGMLTACKELDVALIALLPLGEGALTGKYRIGGPPYPASMRALLKVGQLDLFKHDRSMSLVRRLFKKPYMLQRERLEPLFVVMDKAAKAHNATIPQVALNWLLASNPLVIPIPGQKNAGQAKANAATLSWRLTAEEFEHISDVERAIWRSQQNS